MAVPLLQYAQMPIIQPRSEMADFSNALLNAGRMRTERLAQEEARAAAAAQQQFQNQMAQSQLGIQQEQLGLQKQSAEMEKEKMGMAREQFAREGQIFDLNLAEKQRQAQRAIRDEQFNAMLSQPEHVQAMQNMDIEDQLNYRKNLAMQAGVFDDQDNREYMEGMLKVLDFKQNSEVNDLRRAEIGLRMQATKLDMELARKKDAQGGGLDQTSLLKSAEAWGKLKDDNVNMIKDAEDKAFALNKASAMILGADDIEQVDAYLKAKGVDDPEFAKLSEQMRRFSSLGKEDPQKKTLLKENISKRLKELENNYTAGLPSLKKQANEYATKEYSFLNMATGGQPTVRNIYDMAPEQPAVEQPQQPGFVEQVMAPFNRVADTLQSGMRAAMKQQAGSVSPQTTLNVMRALAAKDTVKRPSKASLYSNNHIQAVPTGVAGVGTGNW